ncbi:MAG TPA: ABC transporter substrate-binding protein [Candidatus Polarisedimenticolaceae bacterium]|nr:ABC transporter substrate-binding protein [Candidatus Polarisedimenticolaceae bacterium]
MIHRWRRSWPGRLGVLLASAALVSVCACGGPPVERPGAGADDESPRQGGTAVLGSISDVDSWNEYTSQQSFASNVLRRIYLRLADDRGTGLERPEEFAPSLATDWQVAEDGLAITFFLREARWSDGVPLTADDVRFTWQAQTEPAVPWPGAVNKRRITDVEVVDPRTVRFHFDGRYPYQFADAVDGGILPRHRFGEIPFDEWMTHDWSQYSIGSGPFVLSRHVPQQEIVLERNLHYFEPELPRLDRVVVRIVPDVLTLLTQLQAGEIDWIDGIPPREAERLADAASAVSIVPFDYPGYDFIGWNEARAPFDDAEVRRALTMAIDRAALVEELLYGYGEVAGTPVPSGWWGADRSIRPLPYDPEGARRLLASRGFRTVGADGVERPGEVLTIEILTNNGNRLRRDALVKVQQQLDLVGVEATVHPLEAKALRHQVGAGDYDAFLGGWVFVGRVDLAMLFGGGNLPPNGLNVVQYRSASLDELLDRLQRADSAIAMGQPLHEIQRQLHRDQPYTLLYEAQRIAAHGPRLRGVEVDVPADPLAALERFWVDSP